MEVAFPAGAKGRPRRRRSIRGDGLGGEENSHSWGGTGRRRKKRFGIGLMGFSVRLLSKEFPSDGRTIDDQSLTYYSGQNKEPVRSF
jgi:hypothetical protein